MDRLVIWIVPAVVVVLVTGPAWGQTVKVSPWGAPKTESFPPDTPPGDLAEGEAADATPFAAVIGASHTGTWNAATRTYTINKLGDIDVSGFTRIRLPKDADPTLKGHEQGHDDLNRNEYEKNAKRKVEEAFKGLNGMRFTGEGATDAARQADARAKATKERNTRLQRAQDAILQQMNTLNTKYDTLTTHGTSDSVNTADGKKQAIAERDKAPNAGGHGFIPDLKRPFGLGALATAFSADGTRLLLGGSLVPSSFALTLTAFPGDPLAVSGAVTVGPMVVIGLTETGAVHLADTRLVITETETGTVLLDGFLFELAYAPATVPGFAAMIQGFLDIPPPVAPGVHNTIGSPLLDALADLGAEGEGAFFWVFLRQPLFDEAGRPLAGLGTVPGVGVIGSAAVPAPASALLLFAGLLAGALGVAMHRPRATHAGAERA
jgi:hypothetical protein